MSIEKKDLILQIVLFIVATIVIFNPIASIYLKIFVFCVLFFCTTNNFINLSNKIQNERNNYISVLSHDLRVSSLAQIRAIELLKSDILEANSNVELLENLDDSCKYSLDMINMLISSYKFKTGENVLNIESFNIKEVIRNNLMLINDERIIFYYDKIANNIINADKYYIKKLISTLISVVLCQSYKNSPIQFVLKNNNKFSKISITYNGNTMSEEEINRMFLLSPKFSTVGQGIKMYLCKKIIDFHKGRIYINSYKNNMNMLTFIIPNTNPIVDLKANIIKDFQKKYV